VLGLRDVLYDAETVRRVWSTPTHFEAIRDWYDAVWIYGDPTIYDALHEYDLPPEIASKTQYTGYIGQRLRLESMRTSAAVPLPTLPPGKIALCVVGGGHDGAALTEAFAQAELPPGTTGVIVNGPLMGSPMRRRVQRLARDRSSLVVLDFVEDTTPLIERADRVIAMGGYNTVCEIMSTPVPALIVPRTQSRAEQRIRAASLAAAGYLEQHDIGTLTPEILAGWLAARLGTTVDRRRAVLDGLIRVPQLAAELLQPLENSDQVSAIQFRADDSVTATRSKDGASRVAV